jgi:hypothetical protein
VPGLALDVDEILGGFVPGEREETAHEALEAGIFPTLRQRAV